MTKRFLSCVLSGCLLALPASAETVRGQVRVIDGDTFRFDSGRKVRIYGIDTLEKNQRCEVAGACVPCGRQTTMEAMKLIGKSEVICELTGKKTYDRPVAKCTVNGKDYAGLMIASGWALAYRSFLPKKGKGHDYVLSEEAAKAGRLGIWAMTFIPPADWRNHKMRLRCEL
jgi:endonuclease YncB( thermonuclease family)